MKRKIRVCELFAGVGGFRVGLNDVKLVDGEVVENGDYNFVYFNQWEPNAKKQFAYDCYVERFREKRDFINNSDINDVKNAIRYYLRKKKIDGFDLLVGGFPCQDYSVAVVGSYNNSKGIEGQKGVLWWSIYDILKMYKPKFVLLENVDRLIHSPKKQKGRDFGIILKCFDELGYGVEWRVINAADFGMPQKRKRVFIFAFLNSTKYYKKYSNLDISFWQQRGYIMNCASETLKCGDALTLLGNSFESEMVNWKVKEFKENLKNVTKNFKYDFWDTGMMVKNVIATSKMQSIYDGEKIVLKDLLENENDVDEKCWIKDEKKIERFRILKGNQKIKRTSKNGMEYIFSQGKIDFPENLEKPARTILTSEGGVSRTSHVIEQNGKFRYLTPLECERINMFPDNWTKIDGMTNRMRYFLMGNALVCGVLNKLKDKLKEIISCEIE